MPVFGPTAVPDIADPGYLGVPLGWWSTTSALVSIGRMDITEVPRPMATRTYTRAWYYVSVGAATGVNFDIGIYNVTTGALLVNTGSVLATTSVGLAAKNLSTPTTIPAGTRVATTLTADGTGITLACGPGSIMNEMMSTAGAAQFGGVNTSTSNFTLPAAIPTLIAGSPGRLYGVMFTT